MLVNGKPLDQFVAENEKELELGAIDRKVAMQKWHRDRAVEVSSGAMQSGVRTWIGTPRFSKHRGRLRP